MDSDQGTIVFNSAISLKCLEFFHVDICQDLTQPEAVDQNEEGTSWVTYVNRKGQGHHLKVLNRGTISGASSPPTPNSDFSSHFGHFILKMLVDLKNVIYVFRKFSLKIVSWVVPPPLQNFGMGDAFPQQRRPWQDP